MYIQINMNKKSIIISLLLATQLLPQLTIFFSDLCLLVATILYGKYDKKILIFFFPLLFLSVVIILFKDPVFYKLVLGSLRIFLLLNLASFVRDLSIHASKNIIKIISVIILVVTFSFNIIGLFDVELYREAINLWNGEHRTTSNNKLVSDIAAFERLSSFFPQPASSGFFHSFLLIFFFMIFLYTKNLLLILVLIFVYLSGSLSKSSILHYFPAFYMVVYLYYNLLKNYKWQFTTLSLMPAFITILIFGFFANEDSFIYQLTNQITGNRHLITGNHYIPFINFGVQEYLIGYSYEDLIQFRKPLGDSSILTKLFIGGIFYYISFILFIIFSYFYLFKIYCKEKLDKFFFILYFALMSFVEIGLTGYYQPQISVLSLLLLCLFLNFKNKKNYA